MSVPTAGHRTDRPDTTELDVAQVLAAARDAEVRGDRTDEDPVRSDRRRVAAARAALRAYAPYTPTRARRLGT